MTTAGAFTVASGRLGLSRNELVVLAEEVGADRVRGLDGSGLLHIGVDVDAARRSLGQRALGPAHADLLGSEAAWVRRALRALLVATPGDRALLALRHGTRGLRATLAGAGGSAACAVSTTFDQPVSFGPVTTVADRGFLVEDLDPALLALRAWTTLGLGPVDSVEPMAEAAAGPTVVRVPRSALAPGPAGDGSSLAAALTRAGLGPQDAANLAADLREGSMELTRATSWWRDGPSEHLSATTWLAGRTDRWLVHDDRDPATITLGPVSSLELARVVRAQHGAVLG